LNFDSSGIQNANQSTINTGATNSQTIRYASSNFPATNTAYACVAAGAFFAGNTAGVAQLRIHNDVNTARLNIGSIFVINKLN
jgi:hypothetical protein